MKFGWPISLGLHGLVLAGGVFLFSKNITPLDEGKVISIDLLTVAEVTNVRAAVKKPKAQYEPTEEPMTLETPLEHAERQDDEAAKLTDDTSQYKQKEATEPVVRVAEATPPVETPNKPDDKPVFDLDRFSDIVDKTRSAQPEKNQQIALQSETNLYEFADVSRAASGEGTGLSVNMLDRLQTEMLRCWRESRDAVNPEKLVVQFRVRLFPDGYVDSVQMLSETGSGPYAAIARQRAAAAIKKCEPYDFLPADKYSGWKDMTLSFRPRA